MVPELWRSLFFKISGSKPLKHVPKLFFVNVHVFNFFFKNNILKKIQTNQYIKKKKEKHVICLIYFLVV